MAEVCVLDSLVLGIRISEAARKLNNLLYRQRAVLSCLHHSIQSEIWV